MPPAAYLLLVEDDPGDARLTEEMFRAAPEGLLPQLHWVTTAPEAIQTLTSKHGCGGVLLDLTLAGTQGLETFATIKPHAEQLPIIVLSDDDDDRLAVAAVVAGAQDYLVKGSFDAAQLRRALLYAAHRKQVEVALTRRALHDELTGAPRRTLLLDRLQVALARAQRQGGSGALLFIDLDRFKQVNDSLGHAAGDKVLQETYRRLVACVRESDTVARFGGDEFVVLLPETSQEEDGLAVGRKLLAALAAPFPLAGREGPPIGIAASIGVAGFDSAALSAEALLERADRAMYRAKSEGRATVVAV